MRESDLFCLAGRGPVLRTHPGTPEARKAEEHQRLHTEPVEDEWYITTDHPMTKTEHIAFAALLSGGSLRVWRQYPEWDFQLRLSRREHGLLVWYSTRDGLLYQLILNPTVPLAVKAPLSPWGTGALSLSGKQFPCLHRAEHAIILAMCVISASLPAVTGHIL